MNRFIIHYIYFWMQRLSIAIHNTELRLILLSITCGQVVFWQLIFSIDYVSSRQNVCTIRPVCFFERFSLAPRFSTMPSKMRCVLGINYSGGRRPHIGGRGPIFRSTACAISIARTPRETASMPPQCDLDLRNWLPIRGPLWHFVNPYKCSYKKRREEKKDCAVDCVEKTCAISMINEIRGPSVTRWNGIYFEELLCYQSQRSMKEITTIAKQIIIIFVLLESNSESPIQSFSIFLSCSFHFDNIIQ